MKNGLPDIRLLSVFLLATSCSSDPALFEVDASKIAADSAELHLCGSRQLMTRHGPIFRTSRDITCEGAGFIIVTLRDGTTRRCTIDYVTGGFADERWQFRLERDQCHFVDWDAL